MISAKAKGSPSGDEIPEPEGWRARCLQAEKERDFYTLLLNSVPQALFIADRQGRVTFWNLQAEILFGRRKAEVLGSGIKDLLSERTLAAQAERIALSLEKGSSWSGELAFSETGRPPLSILLNITPLRDETGALLGSLFISTDISNRKRMESELLETEERYRKLMDISPEAVILTDPAATIIAANRFAASMHGCEDPQELIGRSAFSLIAPEDHPRAKKNMELAAEEKNVSNIEYTMLRKDGRLFTGELSASPILDGAGKLTAFIAAVRDVSERRNAEQALRESESRFRSFIEQSSDGIVLTDEQGNLIEFNQSAEALTGLKREEVLGRPAWEIQLRLLRAERRTPAIIERYKELFIEALRTGQGSFMNRTHEAVLQRADGTLIDFQQTVFPIKTAKGFRLGEIVHNLTEKKRAEEELRKRESQLAQASHLAHLSYWDWELKSGDACWTDEVYQIFGFAPQSFPPTLGRFLELVHPQDREKVKEAIRTSLHHPGLYKIDFNFFRQDGSARAGIAIGEIFTDQKGKATRIVGAFQDITELQGIERALKRSEEQLRQAHKMEAVGRLAGGVAHDFNNLLTIITGYSDLALEGLEQGSPLKADLKEIKRAAQRATELTSQLLAFSRKQILQPKVIDLNSLVSGLDKMLHRVIGEDIELAAMLAPGLRCIKADPSQIEQVIVNLAVNARDAMPHGGRLSITTGEGELPQEYARSRPKGKKEGWVTLTVSDTGQGMSREILSHLFEPFFTTKEKGKGTGLGLAMIYGVVKQSGGYIFCDSEVGKGSTFTIYFPPLADIPQGAAENPASPTDLKGKETVLIVEDEEAVRRFARTVLEKSGYSVLHARDGAEALEVLGGEPRRVDLMITDVVMPHMRGKELSEKAAAIRPGLKVIFISGYAEEVVAEHGVLEEGIQFLPKPFSAQGLLKKVREILDRS